MTIRLSIINFAGIARTLVAVGTSSDADMFLTTAAAAPRSTRTSSPSARGSAAAGFFAAGLSGSGAFSGVFAGAVTPLLSAVFPLPSAACVSVVGSGE
jgi:hypothetical protein